MDPIVRVVSRRIARIAFGTVLLGGMATLAALAPAFGSRCGCSGAEHGPHAWQVLAAMWVLAFGAALFAWSVARRIRFTNPATLQRAGLAVPAAGLACALPLTLHLPFVWLVLDNVGFDLWVFASLIVTGIPHLVFGMAVVQRGADLATTGTTRMTTKRVFIWVTVAACIPWIAAWGIPPVVVMVTLVPCLIPVSYMETLARRERAWLDAAGLAPAIALR